MPTRETEAERQFAARLGARLRELRRRRGLTLARVAQAMGLSAQGGPSFLSRVEQGKQGSVGLFTVARFLKACGAGFEGLRDIAGPPVEPPRPRATAAKATGKAPEPPSRVEPGLAQALQVMKNQRRIARHHFRAEFEEALYAALKAAGQIDRESRPAACEHGRRVFKALLETRTHPRRRELRLAAERRRAEAAGLAVADRFEQTARRLYDEMEQEGALDWLPPAEAARPELARRWLRRTEKAENRLLRDEQATANRELGRKRRVYALMALAPGRLLAEKPLTEEDRRWYFREAQRMTGELSGNVDEPDKGRQWVEELVARHPDRPVLRELADRLYVEFDKARAALAAR